MPDVPMSVVRATVAFLQGAGLVVRHVLHVAPSAIRYFAGRPDGEQLRIRIVGCSIDGGPVSVTARSGYVGKVTVVEVSNETFPASAFDIGAMLASADALGMRGRVRFGYCRECGRFAPRRGILGRLSHGRNDCLAGQVLNS